MRNILEVTFFVVFLSICVADIVVNTNSGNIDGTRIRVLGRFVNQFYGIPYAKPPLNDLRFQKPQPPDNWTSTLITQRPPASCLQLSNLPTQTEVYRQNPTTFSENCLYLNMWVPVNSALKATVIYIHGGGFDRGSAIYELTDGKYLAAENNVIVVTINYRLGPLGFAYLGPDTIPGNMGLWDQHMALTWIKDNIGNFGGSPSEISLFGQGTGAACVGFHLMSPASWDLFDFAVMQSGSPTAYWSHTDADTARNNAMKLGELNGCSAASDQDLLQCFKDADPQALIDSQSMIASRGFPFVPVIDGMFLSDSPMAILKSGYYKNTSIIAGVMKDEATLFMNPIVADLLRPTPVPDSLTLTEAQYNDILDIVFNATDIQRFQENLTMYYGSLETPGTTPDYVELLKNLWSDLDFKCPIIDFLHYYSVNNPSYLYSFEHRITLNPLPAWVGAPHTYELESVFGLPLDSSFSFTNDEKTLSRRTMTYFTNLPKSGQPNQPDSVPVTWPEYSSNNRHVKLDIISLSTVQGLQYQQCFFIREFLPLLERKIIVIGGGGSSEAEAVQVSIASLLVGMLMVRFL
ncbi:cholinesterase-like [Haliotis rubra]|uniref:cholinesterase-like n=1 Tax=Haliotis rubra TaxID=36100 RepID=UPI001EE5B7E8|nr:cholinesterase-like [Haliotis rubra]